MTPDSSCSQYTETGENSWTLVHHDTGRHNVVGFGNASIPSYACLAVNLSDRQLSVCCLTWNINERPAAILRTIGNFFNKKATATVLEDIIVIAIQEIPAQNRKFHEEALAVIESLISRTHSIYFSHRAWSQMVMIFIATPHLKYAIDGPSVKFIPCKAVAKPIRTKGSIGICFRIYQRMIVVVGSHFSHSKVQNRMSNYHKMVQHLRFPTMRMLSGRGDGIFDADIVLWMGDLNFRLSGRSEVLRDVLPTPEDVIFYDELTREMRSGKIFSGFREARIGFPPTHKLEANSGKYVAGKLPSYTDRVLYWANKFEFLQPVEYSSLQDVTQSDHRPVYCCFNMIVVNKPIPARFLGAVRGSPNEPVIANQGPLVV